MVRPRIFISHSSKDRAETEALCRHLRPLNDADELGCEAIVDFDVLVDYDRLVAGAAWPKQLHHWMARCHAAAILLTTNAVQSAWVLKEATILAWRLSLDENFRLFTIRFPDVSDESLTREKFDPLMLDQIERVDAYDAVGWAKKIRESVTGSARNRTPFDELVGLLSDLFAQVEGNTLRRIAENVSVDPPDWQPGLDADGEKQQFTEAIARNLIGGMLGRYETDGIHKLISDLGATTGVAALTDILRLVAPYWVDAGAAGKLATLLKQDSNRVAALNGRSIGEFTAKMYVRRAHPADPLYYPVIQTAGGSAGNLADHYTSEICKYLRKRRTSASKSDQEIIDRLKRGAPRYYVVIPEPVLDKASLTTLVSRFPKVTFILGTGETLERDPNLADVVWLTPEVDLVREEKEYDNWLDAKDIIEEKADA